jgi:hypothetical protein
VDGYKESGRLTSPTFVFDSEAFKLPPVARVILCLDHECTKPASGNASHVHAHTTVVLGCHRDLFLNTWHNFLAQVENLHRRERI